MKTEMTLNIPSEYIKQIADEVAQRILPYINSLNEPDQYLNSDEAAALLGKSKAQIYQWVNRSKHGLSNFPYQKAGRSLRFSKNEIIKWMKLN